MNKLSETGNVQDVVQDILSIRRSINAFQSSKEGKIGQSAYQAQLVLQGIALFFNVVMIAIEVFGNHWITRNLVSPQIGEHGNFLIALSIGAFLALCVSISYFTVSRAAKNVGDDLNNYIKRNFTYLKNLTHVSDLMVKFIVIGTLLHVGRANLIAPFLLIFTADYLLQGRFFSLPIRSSQILALFSFAGAGVMFILNIPEVLWPLIWFAVLTVLSIKRLQELKRVED